MPETEKTINNECLKLNAQYLNGLAVSTMTVLGFSALVAALLVFAERGDIVFFNLMMLVFVLPAVVSALICSIVLHKAAKRQLRRLV